MIWKRSDYWLEHDGGGISGALAGAVYRRVMRRSFEQPGFAVVALPGSLTSIELRRVMVELKGRISNLFYEEWCERLNYRSLGRFDQQNTTKLHLDGGPERSFLMLGYESTEVASEFLIADYAACAGEMGLTPAEFLTQHNPMLTGGAGRLEPWTTTVSDWGEQRSRIVVINNSSTSQDHPRHTAGVLHGARIPFPDAAKSRIINSTMIAVADGSAAEDSERVAEFLTTSAVSGVISARA